MGIESIPIPSSFDRKRMGRSRGIEAANREFKGLLDAFEGQGLEVQGLILDEVKRLKEKCGEDPEQFLKALPLLGEICVGATRGMLPGIQKDEIRRVLSDRFEELEKRLEEARQSGGNAPESRETLH